MPAFRGLRIDPTRQDMFLPWSDSEQQLLQQEWVPELRRQHQALPKPVTIGEHKFINESARRKMRAYHQKLLGPQVPAMLSETTQGQGKVVNTELLPPTQAQIAKSIAADAKQGQASKRRHAEKSASDALENEASHRQKKSKKDPSRNQDKEGKAPKVNQKAVNTIPSVREQDLLQASELSTRASVDTDSQSSCTLLASPRSRNADNDRKTETSQSSQDARKTQKEIKTAPTYPMDVKAAAPMIHDRQIPSKPSDAQFRKPRIPENPNAAIRTAPEIQKQHVSKPQRKGTSMPMTPVNPPSSTVHSVLSTPCPPGQKNLGNQIPAKRTNPPIDLTSSAPNQGPSKAADSVPATSLLCIQFLLESGYSVLENRPTKYTDDETITMVCELFDKPLKTHVFQSTIGGQWNPVKDGRKLAHLTSDAFDEWYIPVNVGFHWGVGRLNRGSAVLKIYDSMCPGTVPNTAFVRKLIGIVNHHSDTIVDTGIHPLPMPCQQQTDDYNCGIFLLHVIETLLRGLDPCSIEVTPEYLRYKYAVMIMKSESSNAIHAAPLVERYLYENEAKIRQGQESEHVAMQRLLKYALSSVVTTYQGALPPNGNRKFDRVFRPSIMSKPSSSSLAKEQSVAAVVQTNQHEEERRQERDQYNVPSAPKRHTRTHLPNLPFPSNNNMEKGSVNSRYAVFRDSGAKIPSPIFGPTKSSSSKLALTNTPTRTQAYTENSPFVFLETPIQKSFQEVRRGNSDDSGLSGGHYNMLNEDDDHQSSLPYVEPDGMQQQAPLNALIRKSHHDMGKNDLRDSTQPSSVSRGFSMIPEASQMQPKVPKRLPRNIPAPVNEELPSELDINRPLPSVNRDLQELITRQPIDVVIHHGRSTKRTKKDIIEDPEIWPRFLAAHQVELDTPEGGVKTTHIHDMSCLDPVPSLGVSFKTRQPEKRVFMAAVNSVKPGRTGLIIVKGPEGLSLFLMSWADWQSCECDKRFIMAIEEEPKKIIGRPDAELWTIDPSRESAFLVFPLLGLARLLQGHDGTRQAQAFIRLATNIATIRQLGPKVSGPGRNGERDKQAEKASLPRISCFCGWTQIDTDAGMAAYYRHYVKEHKQDIDSRLCKVSGCKGLLSAKQPAMVWRHKICHLKHAGIHKAYIDSLASVNKVIKDDEYPMKWRCNQCESTNGYMFFHKNKWAYHQHLRFWHTEKYLSMLKNLFPNLWTDFNWSPIVPLSKSLQNLTEYESQLQSPTRHQRAVSWLYGDNEEEMFAHDNDKDQDVSDDQISEPEDGQNAMHYSSQPSSVHPRRKKALIALVLSDISDDDSSEYKEGDELRELSNDEFEEEEDNDTDIDYGKKGKKKAEVLKKVDNGKQLAKQPRGKGKYNVVKKDPSKYGLPPDPPLLSETEDEP